MKNSFLILIFLCLHVLVCAFDFSQIVFVIMSQNHPRHVDIALKTEENLKQKLVDRFVIDPEIYLLHRDFQLKSSWAIFPMLPKLTNDISSTTKWFAFLDEAAEVNLSHLERMLTPHNSDLPILVGKLLFDKRETILHALHDPRSGLGYPDLKAGFLMTSKMAKLISKEVTDNDNSLDIKYIPKYWTVDASFDLAKSIHILNEKKELNCQIANEPNLLCPNFNSSCALFLRNTNCQIDPKISVQILQQTLFAVKTCKKFHKNRLPIIRDTWGAKVPNIIYASDSNDEEFETIVFTEARNQCLKAAEILRYFDENADEKNWKWLAIVDDDTLISFSKLVDLLQCYQNYEQPDLALGEVYGFKTLPIGPGSFSFLAGGSGKVLSRSVVEKLVKLPDPFARCKLHSDLDDAMLGSDLDQLNISLVHSDQFHQYRPEDYSQDILSHQDPLSFHKFENSNPRQTYDHWFRTSDENLLRNSKILEEL